ncbi:MAG: immunoglobulin domain-containing protein [Bacteroidales bacterium]|nr:immunoglobulin domain-containing protein [Bacteroidales bacterium]MBN2750643.1 immunoglobulin domain-containing protein [Bacteroidales bacterium]
MRSENKLVILFVLITALFSFISSIVNGQSITSPANNSSFIHTVTSVALTATPASGAFSGPGVIDLGGGSGTFNPSVAGVGTHEIHYIKTGGGAYDVFITVHVIPAVTFAPSQTTFCVGGNNFAIDGYVGTPAGGTFTFSGPGVISGTFYPAVAGIGTHSITATYTLNGESNSASANLIVQASPSVTLNGLQINQCQTEPDYTIRAQDPVTMAFYTSGTFTGPGITDNGDGTAIFSPIYADLGYHDITYTYTDANSCTATITQTVRVGTEIFIEDLASAFCLNSPVDNFTYRPDDAAADPINRVTGPGITDNLDGTATFDPAAAGVGTHTITYTFVDAIDAFITCTNVVTQIVQVNTTPVANFSGLNNDLAYCFGAPNVTLAGNYEPAGTFSGDGITDHGNGTATFSPSSLLVGTYSITYTFTNSSGCVDSETKTVEILPLPTQYNVSGGGTFCEGTGGLPIGLANSTTGIDYTLYRNGNPVVPANVQPGNTGVAIAFGNQLNNGVYTAIGTNTTTGCSQTMAGSATIIVIPTVNITTHPANTTICENGSATFTVEATGDDLHYQWTKNGVNIGIDNNVLVLNNVPLTDNGHKVYCTVTSGTCGGPLVTTEATLYVNPLTQITTHPVDEEMCAGQSVTFTVASIGLNRTYQWKIGAADVVDIAGKVSGSTTSTLTIQNLTTADAGLYSCVVTGDCGMPVQSNQATLVVDAPIVITAQPTSITTCLGSNVSFSTTATGTNLAYQWYFDQDGAGPIVPVALGTASSQPVNGVAAANVGTYYCVISSPCGATATTNSVTLSILAQTQITTPPTGGIVCEGSSINLTVAASGTALQYEWYLGGVLLNNGAIVNNATTANLLLNGITNAYQGNYTVRVIGTCGTVISAPAAVVIVDEPVVFTTQPTSTAVCAGSDATFSVAITGDITGYQWQRDIGAGFVPIAGATNASYTLSTATTGDDGNYRCLVNTTNCGNVYSNEATLTVTPATAITTQPEAAKHACVGSTVSFSVTATGSGLTYQWYKNGVSMGAGATTSTLTLTNITAADAASYTCEVTSACGGTITSDQGILTIDTTPVISVHPQSKNVCENSATQLTVSLSSGTNPVYQWYFDNGGGSVAVGINSPIHDIPVFGAANQGDYRVTITNGCGTFFSQTASLALVQNFTITTQPSNTNVCEGATATFTVAANQPVTYQWRRNGVDIAGATSASLVLNNVAAADNGAQYSCLLTNECGSQVSNAGTLSVSTSVAITQQPQSEAVCLGEPLTLNTVATGTNLSYQWYKNGVSLGAGATAAAYNIAAFAAGDVGTYYCIVSNGCGSIQSSNANITQGVVTSITNPTDISICEGTDATFSITATGSNLSYEWRKNDIPITDDGRITGATTISLSIANTVLSDEGTYNVVVTGSCGLPATSTGAYLDITAKPVITAGPDPQTVCDGTDVSFSVVATGDALTYQWQRNTVNIGGATNPTLNLVAVTDANEGIYRCIVTNSCGFVTSTSAELIVDDNVVVNTQPSAVTSCEGSTVTFTANVSGPSTMALQWFKGVTPISNSARINGATLQSLSIGNITSADAGDYWLQVQSTCGNTVTNAATLTVHERIGITQQPQSITVCPAGTLNLSIIATGTVTTYQWLHNGAPVGTNSPTLTISPFNAADAGSYTCELTNICETVVSDVATVTAGVTTTAAIVGDVTACENGNANLAVTSAGTGLTYQWYKGATMLTNDVRIGGSQSASLTINGLQLSDDGAYHCNVSGTCGFDNDNTAILTVQENTAVDVEPVSTSVLVGNTAVFTVAASGSGLTYQWYKGTTALANGADYAGVDTPNLSVLNAQLDDAGIYKCVITGSCGNVESKTATLTVLTSTVITTQPVTPVTICQNESFTIFIETSGAGHTYQWRQDATDLTNGSGISGAQTASLTINTAQPSHSGAYTCVVNGVEISAASIVTVNPTTIVATNPVGGTKCEGDTHTFAVTATGNGLTYQWFKNSAPIAAATSSSYTISPITAADNGTYHCVVTGTCGIATSSGATLSVNAATVVNGQPAATTTICQTETTTLTFDVTGTGLSFLWKKNGQPITDPNISGVTTKDLLVSTGVPSNSGTYTCTVTSACGGAITSNMATLTVRPTTVITTQPIAATKCEGDGVVFTVAATGSTLTYDWQRNGVSIGVTTPTLTLNPLVKATHEGTYTCVVSGDCGVLTSDPAILTVNIPVTLGAAPTISANPVCQNGSTTITVNASGDGLTYQWLKNGAPITGANITGVTSSQLVISNALVSDAGIYTCTVTDACGLSLTSNNATITVNPTTVITTQPLSDTKCSGDEVTFAVQATGTGLTYQWKLGDATGVNITDGAQGSGAIASGATTNILRITGLTAADAGSYTCVVTGTCGTISTTPAVLTVNGLVAITTQPPALTTICEGTSTEINVATSGTVVTYQWKKNGTNLTAGGNISGVNSSKLVISNAALTDAGFYSCEITGTCNIASTQSAELRVNPTTTITQHPVGTTLCEGDNVQFMVSATGVAPITYQWQLNNVNIAGATNSTLTINGVATTDAGAYTCIVTGGSTCGVATSNPANLTVNPRISISNQPVNTTVCEDNTAIISVLATGTSLTYKWMYNNTYLANDGRITGATTNELRVNFATNADEGIYKCEILSTCGSTESNSVTLAVTDSTKITAHPASQTLLQGATAFFSVAATGSGLAYQWQKDNVDIAGAISSTYSIASVQVSDVGQYRCIVTGSCGNVTSNMAILAVNEPVAITNTLADQTACAGETVSFSVTTTGSVTGYQWQFNGANIVDGSGITGAQTANLVIASAATSHSGIYSCVVTGTNNVANSNTAQLTVNDAVSITSHPLTQSKCNGDILVLEVVANGTSYQWQKNGVNIPVGDPRISGITDNKLVITNVTNADAGSFQCVVTNVCTSITSNPAVVTINPVVTITTEPISLTRCETQTAYFSVQVNLSAVSYQWYKNGVPISNTARISGATSANLTINSIELADAGNYSCRVTDNCTYDNSVVATLTVNSATSITKQPVNMTICEGGVAFFEVEASPNGLTYQWQKDGANIGDILGKQEGTTTSVLVINNAVTADQGIYRCLITGGCNDEISNPSTLTVNPAPAAAATITGLTTVCQGAQSVLYVVPEIANAQTYVWDVPYGATIVGGQGTRTIQVDYAADALSGTITVYGQNSCGNGTTSIPLAITVNAMPVAYAGVDQNICSYSTLLEGNDVAGGTWTIISGDAVISNVNQYNTQVNNLLSGLNTFRWTVTQNGCTAYDEVNIVNLKVSVNAGTDQVVCSKEANFSALLPQTGASWRVVNGYGTIAEPNSPTSLVTGLNQGSNVFAWQVNNAGCISFDEVTITNSAPLQPEAGPDQVIAFDETDLDANIPELGTTGLWTVISGGGLFVDATNPKTRIVDLMPGTNIVVWTVSRGNCTLTDTIIVENILVEAANAGTDQTLCVNYTTLNASKPPVGVGEWSVVQGQATFDDKYKPNAKVTNLGPDVNTLRWTVRTSILGVSFDEVTITNNMPTQANAGADMVLCTNQINLSANIPAYGIGTWTLNSGAGDIANVNSNTSLITNLGPGKNDLKWTIDYNGCISEDFVVVTNNTPTVAYAGEDQTICFDSTLLLPNTPTYGVGTWSVEAGRGLFDGNYVTQLAPGTNTFLYTITNGTCTSTDRVNIINNKPTTPDAGYDQSICVNNVVLNANTAIEGIGTWTIRNGSGVFADINSNTSAVTNLAQGDNIFRWTIEKNGCVEHDEVIISNNFVLATAGTDQTLCQDYTQLLASNPTPGIGTWSILAASSATFDDRNSPNTMVRTLSKGSNTFRWTVENGGCVSFDDVIITNNQPTQALAGEDQSICGKVASLQANQPLFGVGAWSAMSGSATFDDATNYRTTVRNLAGGRNILRWTITQGSCVSFDEVVITSNLPENVFAGNDQIACSDTVTLSANPPSLGAGQWSIITGTGTFDNRYLYNTTVRNLGKGDNTFKWTVSSSDCHVSDTVIIRSSIPTRAIAGADQILCSETTVLGGNTPLEGIGSWAIVSGSVTFTNRNLPNTEITGIARGLNILAWTIDKDGCQSTSEVRITNNLPSTPFAGYDRDVCGDSIRLFADPPSIGTGIWSIVSGDANIISPTQNQTQVRNIKFGANTFRWTVTNLNCTMTDDVVITSNYAFVNAGADFEVNTPSAQLIGNKPAVGTGTWRLSAGQATIDNPSNFETWINGLGSGANVFEWSIEYNGCVATDLVTVNYIVWPTADFEPSTYVGCSPLEVNFVNTSIGGEPYSWDFGDGGTSTQPNVIHTFQDPGVYTVRLTATAPLGNTVVKEKKITVHGHPIASFDIAPKEVYSPGQHISCYNYSTHADSSFWNFGDGNALVKKFAPTYTYADTGWFNITLTVKNTYGCTDSMTITNAVHVIKRSDFFFPEAFTPNPNGSSSGVYDPLDRSNDVFYPIVINGTLSEFEMRIYNRAGVLIFETNDILIGWDGYYKNKLLPQDVYIYKVTGRYNSGDKFQKVGNVLLLRIDN